MKKLFMIVFFCSTVKYSISQIINRVPNISTASLSTAVVLNNKLYIIGVLQGTNHLQVFCIDPTQSGSSMVTAITNSSNSYNNGFSQLVTFNNKLFITAQRVIPGNPQNTDLYVSDGTANGTHLFDGFPIDYFSFTSIPSDYLVYKNKLFYNNNVIVKNGSPRTIWVTDGSKAGSFSIASFIHDNGNHLGFATNNEKIYFAAVDGTIGTELWSIDNNNRTQKIKTIGSGYNGTTTFPSLPEFGPVFNDKVYFSYNLKLWVTDGTDQGTHLVDDQPDATHTVTSDLILFNNSLYFTNNNRNLSIFDGSTIRQFNSVGSVDGFVDYKDRMFFAVIDNKFQASLWSTDGTINGTNFFKSISVGPQSAGYKVPHGYLATNNFLFFVYGRPNFNADEIWVSDGTIENTKKITDDSINTIIDIGDRKFFVQVNNYIFFIASPKGKGFGLYYISN